MKRNKDLSSEPLKRPKCSTDESVSRKPFDTWKGIDPVTHSLVQNGLSSGKFGSRTKDIEAIIARRLWISGLISRGSTGFVDGFSGIRTSPIKCYPKPFPDNVINLEEEGPENETPMSKCDIINIDSDEEEDRTPCCDFQSAVSDQHSGATLVKDNKEVIDNVESKVFLVEETNICGKADPEVKKERVDVSVGEREDSTDPVEDPGFYREVGSEIKIDDNVSVVRKQEDYNDVVNEIKKGEDVMVVKKTKRDKDVIVVKKTKFHEDAIAIIKLPSCSVKEHDEGEATEEETNLSAEIDEGIKKDESFCAKIEDNNGGETSTESDGLEDIWNEFSVGLELSKDLTVNHSSNEQALEDEKICEHSFILKDDLGYVCRVCGVIDKGIETIFEFQYNKARSSRTYIRSKNLSGHDTKDFSSLNLGDGSVMPNEIYAHPRHLKKMKPHQREGFNFLATNLVGDNPGGCILAHAPGSGKTFMIICFLQSLFAKYPNTRPLVVLPKGIIPTWKKEFLIWQVEDFPLYDTKKDHNRAQHLDILRQWAEKRSILFLSYQQFSSIICDLDSSDVSTSCRDILLKVPSILVLDEGHTPRNENTDVFQAIAQVETPRKVVLSGTLYQNHVKEVFNILNLVRPNFLKTETSRTISNRIMSKVDLSLKHFRQNSQASFYEVVEETLRSDKDIRTKVSVIQDLREMTSNVLHYYKGDFLEDLPGLVDFTVFLNLSTEQKRGVEKVKKLPGNFKASSAGSAVYTHPKLMPFAEKGTTPESHEFDDMLEKLVIEDGVKSKFFLTILRLCDAKNEKLLVFSQYLTPLKFLERLAMKFNDWSRGREIFFIWGKSSQADREIAMEQFNNSPEAKVFFGSIKACGEGISLVGASRVIIMDIHLNPSVTRQALGRAFRPGQTKKVFVYRLVAADSPEVDEYKICSKKECISKAWFEWKERCGYKSFELETVNVNECGDQFLEGNSNLANDIKELFRRLVIQS